MADEKITTQTASAVVPPAAGSTDPDLTKPETVDDAAEPAVGEGRRPDESVDAQQTAQRDREAAQFRPKTKGRPGRPAAPRAGGYVLTKDGWVLDKKVIEAKPGEPDVTFRKGEGSTVRNAGGWQVGGDG